MTTPLPAGGPPGRSTIAYRTGTHAEFLAAMLQRLSSPAYPALAGLTVRDTDDPAIALLDAAAVMADILTFYSERIAHEGYLRTATEERSLRLLGRLVGHLPRPGIAAETVLAYTLDRDARTDADSAVTIPRGARAQSVPEQGEQPQPFETAEDLPARWSFNDLRVLLRRPVPMTPESVRAAEAVHLEGTGSAVKPADRLLFVFGDEPGQQELLVVRDVTVDPRENVTVVGLERPPAPDLPGELRALIAEARENGRMYARSKIIRGYVTEALEPAAADDDLHRGLTAALRELPLDAARPYPGIHDWLTGWLRPRLRALRHRAQQQTAHRAPLTEALRLDRAPDAATAGLGALLAGLRRAPSVPPAGSFALDRDPAALFGPGSDLGVQLLAALDPRLADTLYPAWRRIDLTEPPALDGLRVMRTVATPFGATAPLQAEFGPDGRVVRYVDWPLRGSQTAGATVTYRDDGRPERADLAWTESDSTVPARVTLPDSGPAGPVQLGPGTVTISVREPAIEGPPAGVTFTFDEALLGREVFVSRPGDDGAVQVRIGDVTHTAEPGQTVTGSAGGLRLEINRTERTVRFALSATLALDSRNVLALDAVYEGIGPESWVVVQRPASPLGMVITRVVSSRVVSRADFGITGKVTELVLADDWLDETDTQLAQIRDTTVYARGDALTPATEPVTDDVTGGEIELARLYEGLTPGRRLVVTGERTDLPETTGVAGTELSMIAAVRQHVDPSRPGETVHTVLTLAAPLSYTYKRDTVRLLANVVPASHGASRDEPIGSGDAGRANQSFRLFQGPLTWLASATPLGASSTLEVRVDGVRWHEVESLAGRGPDERVYTTRADDEGRTLVTFGDGSHGARLPTGYQNVRAAYRVGIGRDGNVDPDRITQLLTRPLWVSAVTNPVPATGGANPDGPGQARRNIPLSVTALDRLVSVADYEDFARARAGIGRAAARRIRTGEREVVHVTVAGVDDVPLGDLRALRASLATYGDPQLPVRVAARELVLLVLAARVKVQPDHAWELVEPAVRRALLDRLGFDRRELAQPAYLSEAIAAAQAVPGVDWVDVDLFGGVPGSLSPADLDDLAATLAGVRAVVPARPARFEEVRHTATEDETLIAIAARYGTSVDELKRLNPGLVRATVSAGRTVTVFRGIRPAQLALLSPRIPDTLILKEAR
ncbi:putative baseplate assembly protein [Catenuloplanes atrovinosus]|uniref:Phage baseplate assembly protein n=1 Tax=Catenuloplanes atrovinosus TaxID=137266 RepID=A0AAE3YPH5_9ACTN|nr:putative baseplate assembly protein [Catenuloplanes atrovinosus]MDR7275496.1 putative phage baseplate assembly protein [Catenuloplanes atrovinosus]